MIDIGRRFIVTDTVGQLAIFCWTLAASIYCARLICLLFKVVLDVIKKGKRQDEITKS